jgi:hypothetical protein
VPSPTPNGSSASVRVFWLDRQQVLGRLRRAVQELTNRHREIEQVILFGPLARGDAVPGSDAGNTFVAHALREGIALFQPVRYSSVTSAAAPMHEGAEDFQNEGG